MSFLSCALIDMNIEPDFWPGWVWFKHRLEKRRAPPNFMRKSQTFGSPWKSLNGSEQQLRRSASEWSRRSCCSLPFRQLNVFLQFKDQFDISHLDSTTNLLCVFTFALYTFVCNTQNLTHVSASSWHSPSLCQLDAVLHFHVCVLDLSCIQQTDTTNWLL